MLRLDCAIQTYQWGKPGLESAVAQLKQEAGDEGFAVEEGKRYAELWMGTHPSGPSWVVDGGDGGGGMLLKEYLKAHPEAMGAEPAAEGDLPFMFKVLSISKALSIQAHPDKALAERLHAARPDVYKDSNHKPEMAISLTDFEALCGFRPLEELVAHLALFPELQALVDDASMAQLGQAAEAAAGEADADEKRALKAVFSSYMTASAEAAAEQVAALAARLEAKQAQEELDPLESLILRLHAHFPGDRGLMGPLFLNYVRLGPGKAFVMKANEPHAYLSGDILECMACSDNVVRVGLTPKYRDVPTLLSMLTYASGSTKITEGELLQEQQGAEHRRFTPHDIQEFEVETVKLNAVGGPFVWPALDGPSLLLVLDGAGLAEESLEGTEEAETGVVGLHKGQVFFVPANTSLVLKGVPGQAPLHVTIAHSNNHQERR